MQSKQLYINGQLVKGAHSEEIVSPATGEVVGVIEAANVAQVEIALEAAKAAFPVWSKTPARERAEWMHKLAAAAKENEEQLRLCVHHEMGKPWAATADDFQMLVDSLEFYAKEIVSLEDEVLEDAEGTHSHILVREPVGVVGAFLAWNFPLLNLAYKLGPALAAGCPIVVKPSVKTPLSAYAVGALCAEIGLPAGVVNIVCGSDRDIGDTISASRIPAMLTLIGSTATGQHVIRTGATSIKRYSMELGGNAPVLVFADADLDRAADTICALKFGNSGQICVAPNRVLADKAIVEELTSKIVERTSAVKVGYDRNDDIDMGPLMDAASWARVDREVQGAVQSGAELLLGGKRPDALPSGYFYAPTVLANVTPDMSVVKNEIFGPVVSIMTFEDEAQALDLANDTDAGLTAYIFTSDEARASRLARELRFGEIQVNGVKYAINLPHGGIKQSGIGVDCSHLALDDYLSYKRISRALPQLETAR